MSTDSRIPANDVALIANYAETWLIKKRKPKLDAEAVIAICGHLRFVPWYRAECRVLGSIMLDLFSQRDLWPDDRDSLGDTDEDAAAFVEMLERRAFAFLVESRSRGDDRVVIGKIGPERTAPVSRGVRLAAGAGDAVRLPDGMLNGAEVHVHEDGKLELRLPKDDPIRSPWNYFLAIGDKKILEPDEVRGNSAWFRLPPDTVAGDSLAFLYAPDVKRLRRDAKQ